MLKEAVLPFTVGPGTCIFEQVTRDGGSIPIIMVAAPTTGHTESFLLRFANRPSVATDL